MPSSDSSKHTQRLLGVLAGAVALYLVRLGSFGFWDPTEVRVADAARAMLEPTGGPPHAALNTWLVAHSFHRFGIGEFSGRLPMAVCSILAILATYWVGRTLLRPRGALLAAIALGTMPSFLFGARQLTSAAPLTLASVLALGGLVYLVFPSAGAGVGTRMGAAIAALAGLGGGFLAAGVLVGVLAPLVAITAALAVTRVGRARAIAFGLLSAAIAVLVILACRKRGVYSELLGGSPRAAQLNTVVTSIVRTLGFSTLPWLVVAPFSVLRALDGSLPVRDADDETERATFTRILLIAWLAALYLCATLHSAIIADLLVPAGPAIALLAGAYLDELFDFGGSRAIEGITVAAFAVLLGHDVLLTTDAFVSTQSLELIRWPVQLYWMGNVLFGLAALFGLCCVVALVVPTDWPSAKVGRPSLRRVMLLGAIATQIALSVVLVQWLIPAASKHLSPKDLYGKTRQLDPKAPLAQYRFNATGASYYMNGRTATALNTLDELIAFLKRPERVFIFVGGDELASIDQATRGGAHPPAAAPDGSVPAIVTLPPPTPYFVIDDSNSHFLILSNQLGPRETDLNPIRRFVSEVAPVPKTKLAINFDDKLQLIGYDIPEETLRGADVRVRLYFKVLAPVGGAYKVFIHFDGPGSRINGDHVPLDGKFPTQFWTAGTYVTDEHIIKPERSTQPSGTFQMYFGLFAGDKRLKVKDGAGASDGENRVHIGNVRVK